MTIQEIRTMALSFSTVALARVRNTERDQRSIAGRVAAGENPETARAEVRAFRGSVLGAMMREFNLKDAKSEDPGVLELLVYIAYKRIDQDVAGKAEENLASL